MASPAKKPETDEKDWLLPLGVVGVVALFALKFVGQRPFADPAKHYAGLENDTTVQILQFAIDLGALAVIGWGLKLTWEKRGEYKQVLRDRLLVALGLCAFVGYFNFAHLHFGNFVHVWDTYHYVMGSKYFPETGYDLMYDCAAVADVENGRGDEVARQTITDLRTNVIVKAEDVVAHPERCKDHFTTARWAEYRKDIAAFRSFVNEGRWREIHLDHGYNATPVWTLAGYWLTNGGGPVTMKQLTRLNLIDPIYLLLTVLMVWWAFGPRAFAVAAIVLGTHFPNRYYWTGGAFLRHDWVFYFVASIALLKKKHPYLAGAAFSYTVLLRLFPGLAVAGVVVSAFEYWRQHKKIDPMFTKYVVGGAVATVVLVGASFAFFGGPKTWQAFAANTIKHSNTPLTNHMGLRTVLSWRPGDIGQKTAGGFRQRLRLDANERLVPFGGDEVDAPIDATYGLTLRGFAESAAGVTVVVDGQPVGKPVTFDTSVKIENVEVPLTAGPHTLALAPLAAGQPQPRLEFIELNRIGTLDGWWYWKWKRLDNWSKTKPVMWLVFLAGLALIWLALRNTGTELWLGAAMGVGFIVIGAELTNYYYCFLMGMAVLHEKKREVGAIFAALSAVSHLLNWGPWAWMSHWLDEQYVTMSLAALFAVFGIWWLFTKNASDVVAPEEPPMHLFGAPALATASGPAVGAESPSRKKKKKR